MLVQKGEKDLHISCGNGLVSSTVHLLIGFESVERRAPYVNSVASVTLEFGEH